jgi:hypothetical protein
VAKPARRPLFGKGEGTLARVFGSLQRAVQFAFELQSLGKRQIEAAQRSLLDQNNPAPKSPNPITANTIERTQNALCPRRALIAERAIAV